MRMLGLLGHLLIGAEDVDVTAVARVHVQEVARAHVQEVARALRPKCHLAVWAIASTVLVAASAVLAVSKACIPLNASMIIAYGI